MLPAVTDTCQTVRPRTLGFAYSQRTVAFDADLKLFKLLERIGYDNQEDSDGALCYSRNASAGIEGAQCCGVGQQQAGV